jgi:L-threonylcarbamoyladenylate synthase
MHVFTDSPAQAAKYLARGEVVAFPTETVYGLGASIDSVEALEKVFRLKGRPPDNPLIVHCDGMETVSGLAILNSEAENLLGALAPGPLTLVLPKRPGVVSPLVTAGLDTVALRIPSHEVAQALLAHSGSPIAAPSANRSGYPSPTEAMHVHSDLGDTVPCILTGEVAYGVESTIVDCRKPGRFQILRAGSIGPEDLAEVLGYMPALVGSSGSSEAALSPGQRYRHYAPRARVILGQPPTGHPAGWIGIEEPERVQEFREKRVLPDWETYGRELYGFLRHADQVGLRCVCCQVPPERGLGLAIRDRLHRAASAEAS